MDVKDKVAVVTGASQGIGLAVARLAGQAWGQGGIGRQVGGMILNISSRISKSYFPNLGAYTSTKYALNAISLTARQELAEDNITRQRDVSEDDLDQFRQECHQDHRVSG